MLAQAKLGEVSGRADDSSSRSSSRHEKFFSLTTRTCRLRRARQGEGKGRAEARHGRMTRQMLYAIDRALMESSRWFCWHEMVTAECRVLDVCDILLSAVRVVSPKELKKNFGHFQFSNFFFSLSPPILGPPFFNRRRGWA